jgi:hypothetical protein
MPIAVAVFLLVVDTALLVVATRRPLQALRWLLILLPLHSLGTLILNNVIVVADPVLLAASAWKEFVVAGIAIAAVLRLRRPSTLPRVDQLLGTVLLGIIVLRMVTDMSGGADPLPVLYGARQLGEFLVLFLAVSILRPSPAWFLQTAKPLAVVVAVAALIAAVEPSLGAGFYDHVYHRSGELLHHSYLVDLGDELRFRAAGTFIAPNEFGLAMVILGAAVIAPLIGLPGRVRWASFTVILLAGVGLLLSFSRSAWVGVTIAVIVVGLLLRRSLREAWATREYLHLTPRTLLGIAFAVLTAGALLFVSIGGTQLLVGTVSGNEASAAGRGASLAGGLREAMEHAGGLGLGTAGPTAYEFSRNAVLTENWYLVYGVQLGLVPMALVASFAIIVAVSMTLRAVRWWNRVVRNPVHANRGLHLFPQLTAAGATVALLAALAGGMVIPALLDLPGSLILWSIVAMVLGWTEADAFPAAAERAD